MRPEPKVAQNPAESTAGVDMNLIVGYVLLVGVVSSIALLTIGMAWNKLQTGHLVTDYELGHTNILQFVIRESREVWHGHLQPRVLINFGIAVLMMTPFARVLASTVYFAVEERNLKYTLFTTFVLLTLSYSLLLQ